MARFHPHGDSAIYDALARMAQPFSLRHPLIDFHGNYGSPEDPPAAARYTECRLHPLALSMLAGIDESTVDFVANYSGDFVEPSVLPARLPNLLVNGSQGIAVGMATNIPPPQPGRDHRRGRAPAGPPLRRHRRLAGLHHRPRLPHRGPNLGARRHRVGLPHRPGPGEDASRGGGDRNRQPHRAGGHRAALSGVGRGGGPQDHRLGRQPSTRRHRRRQRRVLRRRHPLRHHPQAGTPTPRWCSTTSGRRRPCSRASP